MSTTGAGPAPTRRPTGFAPSAAVALAGSLLLGACASAGGGIAAQGPSGIVPRSADERVALTLSSWTPPNGYSCVLEEQPVRLPAASELVDVARLYGDLVTAWSAVGRPKGDVLLSVGYNSTGRPDRFHIIESTLGDSSLARDVATLVDQRLFRQQPGEAFGVRLRVTVDSIPAVAVGRRETCYPRWADTPVIGSIERDPMVDDLPRQAQSTRYVAFRLFADADGTVQDVYLQSRPARVINTGELIESVRRTTVDEPALLDRQPVGFWFTVREDLRGTRQPIGRLANVYDQGCLDSYYWYGSAGCGLGIGSRYDRLAYGGLGYGGFGYGLGPGGFGWGGLGYGMPVIIVVQPPSQPQPPPAEPGEGEGEGEPKPAPVRGAQSPWVPVPGSQGTTPARSGVGTQNAQATGTRALPGQSAELMWRRAAAQRDAALAPSRGAGATQSAFTESGVRVYRGSPASEAMGTRSTSPRTNAWSRGIVRQQEMTRTVAPTPSPSAPQRMRASPRGRNSSPSQGVRWNAPSTSTSTSGRSGSAAPSPSAPAPRAAPAPSAPRPAPTRGGGSEPPAS